MSEILDMPKLIREASEKEGDVWMPIADSWREICTTSSVMGREFENQQSVLENIALAFNIHATAPASPILVSGLPNLSNIDMSKFPARATLLLLR